MIAAASAGTDGVDAAYKALFGYTKPADGTCDDPSAADYPGDDVCTDVVGAR